MRRFKPTPASSPQLKTIHDIPAWVAALHNAQNLQLRQNPQRGTFQNSGVVLAENQQSQLFPFQSNRGSFGVQPLGPAHHAQHQLGYSNSMAYREPAPHTQGERGGWPGKSTNQGHRDRMLSFGGARQTKISVIKEEPMDVDLPGGEPMDLDAPGEVFKDVWYPNQPSVYTLPPPVTVDHFFETTPVDAFDLLLDPGSPMKVDLPTFVSGGHPAPGDKPFANTNRPDSAPGLLLTDLQSPGTAGVLHLLPSVPETPERVVEGQYGVQGELPADQTPPVNYNVLAVSRSSAMGLDSSFTWPISFDSQSTYPTTSPVAMPVIAEELESSDPVSLGQDNLPSIVGAAIVNGTNVPNAASELLSPSALQHSEYVDKTNVDDRYTTQALVDAQSSEEDTADPASAQVTEGVNTCDRLLEHVNNASSVLSSDETHNQLTADAERIAHNTSNVGYRKPAATINAKRTTNNVAIGCTKRVAFASNARNIPVADVTDDLQWTATTALKVMGNVPSKDQRGPINDDRARSKTKLSTSVSLSSNYRSNSSNKENETGKGRSNALTDITNILKTSDVPPRRRPYPKTFDPADKLLDDAATTKASITPPETVKVNNDKRPPSVLMTPPPTPIHKLLTPGRVPSNVMLFHDVAGRKKALCPGAFPVDENKVAWTSGPSVSSRLSLFVFSW
ncbi:hypothetical protein GALMADRAFT_215725 [Galerina marginata CBS 339.88]|uniref:Uncharacterized protein n=1 Tax=Galerina marginata (strain CBS 339.88) TaxID=685588 RepID=A0A067SP85_GALM3|nr:hypothetical protein GALMADRAFT_215725 [Galerina marginata CBS 339.88]